MAIESLDPQSAHASMSAETDAVFVDVRTVEEFDLGHPEGAVNVPWALRGAGGMSHNPDFLPAMKSRYAPGTKLYISCQAGGRSLKACEELAGAGYTNLVNVDGGYGGRRDPSGALACPGWVESGLPTASDKSDYAG